MIFGGDLQYLGLFFMQNLYKRVCFFGNIMQGIFAKLWFFIDFCVLD